MPSPDRPMAGIATMNSDGRPSSQLNATAGLPAVRKRTRPVVPPARADHAAEPGFSTHDGTLHGGSTAVPPDARDDNKHYEVGYCRPPVNGQFKAGRTKTGGRKKTVRNTATIVKEHLDQKHAIARDGKRVKTSTREIIIAQAIKKAANGDLKAANWLFGFEDDGSAVGGEPVNSGQAAKETVSAAEKATLRDHFQRKYAVAGLSSEQIETVLASVGLGLGASGASE